MNPICPLFFMTLFLLVHAKYRLEQKIIPQNYQLHIKLNKNFSKTNNFQGEVNISLLILNETKSIKIHSRNLTLVTINLNDGNNTYRPTNKSQNNVTDILLINFNETLPQGAYNMSIKYVGKFSSYDLHGFYKSNHKNQNLVSTQLHPTHARKTFPCFDEPKLKASFDLQFTYPNGYKVMANTLEKKSSQELSSDMQHIEFETTPVMSTYLLAFVISNFTCTSLEKEITYRVCSRDQTSNQRKYALQVVPKAVKFMEDFTNISYNVSGINKVDLVAIPDFSEGAMENWGLITFQETALLWDPTESSNSYKQRVASVVTHEIAHMWFGNLVTMKWWSDPFLNEGFARYFQYFATAKIEKDWKLEKQFVIEQVQKALAIDSPSSLALSSYVEKPEDISDRFDSITYNKGASIIRMLEFAIGPENFKKGLQKYLLKNKFNSTTPEDLWDSFKQFTNLTYPIDKIVYNWTHKPGYPVINVRNNGTTIIISQDFLDCSGKNSTQWYVPITYTTSKDKIKFDKSVTPVWLAPNQNKVLVNKSDIDWIILNNQQLGFYRVNYNEDLWNRIEKVLKKNLSEINELNRAQIVDDLFNFAIAGQLSFSELLHRVSFLKYDIDYYPWYSAFNGFATILPKINDQKINKKLMNYVTDLMKNLYASVPFISDDPENQIYTLKQVLAINWACKLDHPKCIRNSEILFSAHLKGVRLRKNFKLSVYCTVLRHSKNKTDWEYLWNEFETTDVGTEEAVILEALGCSNDSILLEKFLFKAINTSSGIRKQDSSLVFNSIIKNSPKGVETVLNFLTKNFDLIYDYHKERKTVITLVKRLAMMVTKQEQIEKLSNIARNETHENEVKETLPNIIAKAKSNLNLTKKLEDELDNYFKKEKNSATILRNEIFWFSLLCIVFFSLRLI